MSSDRNVTVDRDVATVVDGPRNKRTHEQVRSAQGRSGASTAKREQDAVSFLLALRNAEIARTRKFVPIVIAMAVIALALLELVGGDWLARLMLRCGIAGSIIATLYLYKLARDVDAFTEGRVAIAYAVCIVGVFTGVFYWGIFSPAAAIVALGIFFVGIGRSTRIGTSLYSFCIVCQGALAIAILSGAIKDRGLIATPSRDTTHALQQVMLQVVYLATFLVARATRSQLDRAVSDHDRAVRAVAQRDALLVEARQDLDHALKIGGPGRYTDQVVGSFRLGVVIGRGAMGEVYSAVHTETGEEAAVKLLASAAHEGSEQLTRLYREARAAARLESPHIVKLLEVNADADAIPYLAMERLHGHDLAQILRERRCLPLAEVVELAHHIAHGLESARRAGVVHRDIKPQNLFYAEAGKQAAWKILDFGVSKLDTHQGTLTQGHVVGTPMYMAPEQARGEPVDHRSDSFALATVLYRALTGQPPYTGGDVPSILYNVVHKIPQCPSELVSLPDDVDRVLAIGLAKDPDLRFVTAGELADALAAAAGGRLDHELRARADKLIAAQPWGSTTWSGSTRDRKLAR